MNVEMNYKRLANSLKLLSLSFDDQIKYFPEFVDIPFEILDAFSKAFMLLPELLEWNKVSCKVIPNLLRLHNLINLELANPDFDTLDSVEMCSSKEWDRIRSMAKEILIIMEEPLGEPEGGVI